MALLERVATLMRANLNDLIDKAEDPEKMIKQVILDMQNQLLQVKTQVAISIADQHLLEKKQKESQDRASEWMRKAELAVDKITVVSTGNGDAAGMNKITGDLTKMAAQVPALFETLSGMNLSELFSRVRQIGDKAPKPDGLPPADKGKGAAGTGK